MISFSVSDEIIVVIYGSHQELTIKISPISSKLNENVIYFFLCISLFWAMYIIDVHCTVQVFFNLIDHINSKYL